MKHSAADIPFKLLINWYLTNKRPLPWRESPTPYHIYISEIVFQQTRIDQGLNYYNSIIEKYPNGAALAKAREQDFLKVWQGLGYYSRAHNMLKSAQILADKYHGELPGSYEELLALPGIGPYTAAAIASIAFGLPFPVVDGNVKRVISRMHCIETPVDKNELTREIEQLLKQRIIPFSPSDFNQALMELGAMVCTPANPACEECPLKKYCCAFKKDSASLFPVKAARKKRPVVFVQYYIAHTAKSKNSFYMVNRQDEKIWQGLFEFPCVLDSESGASINQRTGEFPAGFPFDKAQLVFETSHELSHRQIKASFYEVYFDKAVPPQWKRVTLAGAVKLPVHIIIQKYLATIGKRR